VSLAQLPRGAILATVDLVDVRGTDEVARAVVNPLTVTERAFGDYWPGRFAWLLKNVQPLAEPIPAKGALGLWGYKRELNRTTRHWDSVHGVA
jgi:activating signal cointegrator 1